PMIASCLAWREGTWDYVMTSDVPAFCDTDRPNAWCLALKMTINQSTLFSKIYTKSPLKTIPQIL
ncbi:MULTISPECIES: hypothetical protein, partial [unclassified Adlercreutzia]|uniref:hypothetical protein n=1 Tax=unclassified Adlercreutzia TaxID=2636013 RepID=UPI00197E242B